MDRESIEALLRGGLPGAEVEVDDPRGDGRHFTARIVSPTFAGRTRLERHRMIHAVLGPRMGDAIHALSITAEAP